MPLSLFLGFLCRRCWRRSYYKRCYEYKFPNNIIITGNWVRILWLGKFLYLRRCIMRVNICSNFTDTYREWLLMRWRLLLFFSIDFDVFFLCQYIYTYSVQVFGALYVWNINLIDLYNIHVSLNLTCVLILRLLYLVLMYIWIIAKFFNKPKYILGLNKILIPAYNMYNI